jgi:Domain of unknown function (DUF6766)
MLSVDAEMRAKLENSIRMRRWVGEHSLSLSFILLFAVTLIGQSIAGHISYNSDLAMHGLAGISFASYLGTGNFLDGIFTNWQAALLQLGCLVVFAAKFREKGAAHSLTTRINPHKRLKRSGKKRSWVYRHSLSLAFAVLFALSFIAHLFFGTLDYDAKLRMIGKATVTVAVYGTSSAFWFSNMQTWEAEFSAIAIYVVLSIFLRQEGSPESKPVDSSNDVTGKTNH